VFKADGAEYQILQHEIPLMAFALCPTLLSKGGMIFRKFICCIGTEKKLLFF
jgi:hypothetical protein